MTVALSAAPGEPTSCIVAVRNGVFFGSARQDPVPDKTTLTNPFSAWRVLGDTGTPSINAIVQVRHLFWVAVAMVAHILVD